MKKYLQLFLNPIFGTLLILGIIFSIQYLNGARLAFQVVEVYDSWLKEACQYGCMWEAIEKYPKDCYYYGGCLNMVEEKRLVWLELVLLVFFIFSFFNIWREIRLNRNYISFINFILFIFAYFLYFYTKQSDWFGNCSDFCWFGTIFFFPILLFFVLLAWIMSWRSKLKTPNTMSSKNH